MRSLLLLFLVAGLGCASIPAERARPFVDYSNWVLESDLVYTILDRSDNVQVPAGFVTDYASIPRSVCVFLPKDGRHSRAAIIHDFLYWSGAAACTREQADQLMYLAMTEQGVECSTRDAIYDALRLFGQTAWDHNAQERAQGVPRVVPAALLTTLGGSDGTSAMTWDDFRPQVQTYYADHPGEVEPTGSIQVDWSWVATEFERARRGSTHPWWQCWKKDDVCA